MTDPRSSSSPTAALAAGLLALGLVGCGQGGGAPEGTGAEGVGGASASPSAEASASDGAPDASGTESEAASSGGSSSDCPSSASAQAGGDPETASRWPLLAAGGVRADGESGPAVEVTDREDLEAAGRLEVGQTPGLIWLATEASEGHGVVVGRNGLVLSAHHVVAGEGEVRAAVAVGSRLEEREVEVLGGDRTADVALLRLADGAPGGVPRLVPSLHQGPEGFSGGPAVDEDWAVAGLSVAAMEGHTLVRPLHDALDVAEQVLSGEETDTVVLGAP